MCPGPTVPGTVSAPSIAVFKEDSRSVAKSRRVLKVEYRPGCGFAVTQINCAVIPRAVGPCGSPPARHSDGARGLRAHPLKISGQRALSTGVGRPTLPDPQWVPPGHS